MTAAANRTMTESLAPWRRMTHALVISACFHLLLLVSIVQGYGGKSGTFSIPGVVMVELVRAGGSGPNLNAAPEPTPFPAQPGLNPGAPPGPVPSLDNTAANGSDREPATPRDNSDQASGGDQPGYHSGEPGANGHNTPAVEPPAPAGEASAFGHSLGQRPAPPPPAAPTEINSEPRCASCPPPPYPDLALRRGIEGDVILSVQVLPDGRVGDIFVVKSSGFPFLDEAALTAVKSYTFFPATDETGPVAATFTFTMPFRISGP